MKDRRIKEEIYLKMLTTIQDQTNGHLAKLTNVQLVCKISYDKAKLYAQRLEKAELLTLHPLQLTSKGCEFVKQFRAFFIDFNHMKEPFLTNGNAWKDLAPVISPMKQSKYENLTVEDVKELYQQINNLDAIIELLEEKK